MKSESVTPVSISSIFSILFSLHHSSSFANGLFSIFLDFFHNSVSNSLTVGMLDGSGFDAPAPKKNSKGYKVSWIGYKLHLDCIDGDIPISAILTSASLHDSQAAIPLAQMSSQRVSSLYDLMDSAYDAPQIHSFSEDLGHKPIIDHNPRGGDKKPMDRPSILDVTCINEFSSNHCP